MRSPSVTQAESYQAGKESNQERLPFTIWMGFDNAAEGFSFPVMPEKISISRGGRSSQYQVLGTGSVSVPEKPELAEISFESFFPQHHGYPFIHPSYSVGDVLLNGIVIGHKFQILPPERYVNYINKWMASGYPVRFIYVGDNKTSHTINLPMTIESFERYEEAGSVGDVFFSLKLKEYAFFSPLKVKAVQKDGETVLRKEAEKRSDERVPVSTYKLRPGDTLIAVVKSQLGDSGRWREIQKLNGIKDSELNGLKVGRTLRLPQKKR